jgi:hypothetical protein
MDPLQRLRQERDRATLRLVSCQALLDYIKKSNLPLYASSNQNLGAYPWILISKSPDEPNIDSTSSRRYVVIDYVKEIVRYVDVDSSRAPVETPLIPAVSDEQRWILEKLAK